MLSGKVCDYKPEGKFGFIEVPGMDRTIFFHNSRQRSFYCGLDAKIHDDGGWKEEPKKGDAVVIYGLQQVPKGPRATYWAQADTKTKAEELLTLMHTYRLQHRSGREAVSRLDPKPTYRTVWQGQNLLEVAEFCKDKGIRIERDEFNYFYFEVLVIEQKKEMLTMNDTEQEVTTNVESWERCGDPRPR
jgi:hypothetical protein